MNYYWDMYPKRAEILAPLTNLVGKKTLQWDNECQIAFDRVKALLARDAFLKYPDHNKPFHIYADASDKQLGAAIVQDNIPVAFYSRKLNSAQRNYTTGEKELLSVVETLKAFRTMLYGCPDLHIYTDHRNNIFDKMHTQRVMRWRLYLEDYGVKFHYIKGSTNLLADALSRLPFDEGQNPSDTSATEQAVLDKAKFLNQSNTLQDVNMVTLESTANMHALTNIESYYSFVTDDNDLVDCFVNLPPGEDIPLVVDYQAIKEAQQGDAQLQSLAHDHPDRFATQLLAPETRVMCYLTSPNKPWQVYLPASLLHSTVSWYHSALGHIGQSRLYDTMQVHLYNPNLRNKIEDIVAKCEQCQKYKANLRGYGQTAPRE